VNLSAILVWVRLIRTYGIPTPAGSWQFKWSYWFGLTLSAVIQAALLALFVHWVMSHF
jgi:hypothetical protein